MQYPQIQFYRGSLVRLASGQLKQVEELSSDDFLESAKLAQTQKQSNTFNQLHQQPARSNINNNIFNQHDENNNSVFNSPEPTPSYDSPTMELDEDSPNNLTRFHNNKSSHDDEEEDDDDVELDVVSPIDSLPIKSSQTSVDPAFCSQDNSDDLYIDSSVVRDLLEVSPPSSASPVSLTGSSSSLSNSSNSSSSQSLHSHHQHLQQSSQTLDLSSCSPGSSQHLHHQQLNRCNQQANIANNLTVLIKFFLESSRSIVFIEVPIEHPFFVFHRGWSSWNPQRTYDKFGLKCRKLKIGDTCMSLIRRQRNKQNQQQESDHCNVLFSSIKINE